MATPPPGIAHWSPGYELIAKVSENIIQRVRIVRGIDNEFFQETLVALTPELVTVPSYYCKSVSTGSRLWVRQEDLSEPRPRPYYGPKIRKARAIRNENTPPIRRPRKLKEDHPIPMTVAQPSFSSKPDPNTTYFNKTLPQVDSKVDNAYKDFMRRGKDKLMQLFYEDYIENQAKWNRKTSATEVTGAIIELPLEKELEIYLAQCWRYNQTFKSKMTITTYDSEASNDSDDEVGNVEQKPVLVHIAWCIVCGTRHSAEALLDCTSCPAAFHKSCRDEWPHRIIHRQNLSGQLRRIGAAMKRGRVPPGGAPSRCPCCATGPPLGYGDIVWSKLGSWAWWPARVLEPGSLPPCLLARAHRTHDWPLAYYGDDKNFAWSDISRMCVFLPHHDSEPKRPELHKAIESASEDYIISYLK